MIAIIPNKLNHRIPVHATAAMISSLYQGEFILLTKAAHSYAQNIKTKKNW
jgi:hypothetical protein